jgi:hypothetical protein
LILDLSDGRRTGHSMIRAAGSAIAPLESPTEPDHGP